MGEYDKLLAKSIENRATNSEDLNNLGIYAFYGEPLEKSHVKAHFRRDPKSGKLQFIKDYDDLRDKKVVDHTIEHGKKYIIDNPRSKHHGKVFTADRYHEHNVKSGKKEYVAGRVDGQRSDLKPHHLKPAENKTSAELSAGLKQFVSDYQEARKAGNIKLAKEIKANIDKKIKEKGLDKDKVYFSDAKDTDAKDTDTNQEMIQKLSDAIYQVGQMTAWDQAKTPGSRLAQALKKAKMTDIGMNRLVSILTAMNKGNTVSKTKIEEMASDAVAELAILKPARKAGGRGKTPSNPQTRSDGRKPDTPAKGTDEIPKSPDGNYQIYKVKVKTSTGKIEDRFAVPSRTRKTGQGMGDSLHNTLDEAIKEADFQRKQDITDEKRKAQEAEDEKQKAAEKAKHDDIDGFADDEKPIKKGKIIKTLNKQLRFDGKVMTVKDKIREMVEKGEAKTKTWEENKVKPMSRRAYFKANQAEQDAHDKKIKEGGKKTAYSIGGYELGKTAYDYATYLNSKKK